MHWLTSRKSKLSTENKLKIYKTIIKPIWTYGIPLWGTWESQRSRKKLADTHKNTNQE